MAVVIAVGTVTVIAKVGVRERACPCPCAGPCPTSKCLLFLSFLEEGAEEDG